MNVSGSIRARYESDSSSDEHKVWGAPVHPRSIRMEEHDVPPLESSSGPEGETDGESSEEDHIPESVRVCVCSCNLPTTNH